MARNRTPVRPRSRAAGAVIANGLKPRSGMSGAMLCCGVLVLSLLFLALLSVSELIKSAKLDAANALAAAVARAEAAEARAEAEKSASVEALAAARSCESEALAAAADARRRANSPNEAKRVAQLAFQEAEAWRQKLVVALYANMSSSDWDSAARWKSYAQPDAPERSCASVTAPQVLADILLLQRVASALPAASNRSRSVYLALHAFHSTGLEGNTLTLPETLLAIAGQPLFAGFDLRVQPSRAGDRSATEALNVALLWDAIGLASRGAVPVSVGSITVKNLVDMNSAITRGTDTAFGLRSRAVAVGHQRVLLPMPDEVPVLVQEFLMWLAAAVHALDAHTQHAEDALTPGVLERILALACDAHTRFVFIHPFMDGNGRLARTLAALVLQHFGLPAPMIPRALRAEYMEAVSIATADRSYGALAAMFASAVQRSIACELLLAAPPEKNLTQAESVQRITRVAGGESVNDVAGAIVRGGCQLQPLSP